MNIQEVRTKFPQYSDLSDQQLADALHGKFYADMPKDQFYAKVGFATPTEAPAATAGDRGAAALAGVDRGIAGVVGLPVDTVENILNLGLAGAGTVATAAGRPDMAPDLIRGSFGGSDWVSRLMERYGIRTSNPRPEDRASRMLHMGGMIAGSGGRRPVAPAAAGAVAGEALGPEWVGPASMTPAASRQVVAAVKNPAAQRVAERVQTFKDAGTQASAGQATENSFLQGLENLASKFPGGSGVMRRYVETQQRSMGATTKTGVSAEDAGRAIERGVTGQGGFLQRSKETWQRLDDEMGAKVGSAYNVPPNNTLRSLDELVQPVAGAEKTTGALVNPKIAEIRENFKADVEANMGAIPFDAMRKLRSRVGSMLDDALVTGIPGGELKKLYGALSKDLEAGANAAGAGQEFARQNNFWRARMDRVESVLERVLGNAKQPEDVFKSFFPTDPDQANKVRAVMRSLEPSQRQVVSDAVVNRLGRATPGRQNEMGDVFSSETFLTNWNKISEGARAQLFPNHSTRQQMNAIASAAANIREGSKAFSNPSGTAGSFAAYSVYSSPLVSAMLAATGNVPAAVAVAASGAGAAGSANVGAKMLTNPKVVEWLAKPINPTKPSEAQAHLARLGVIYNSTDDQALREDIERFVESANK